MSRRVMANALVLLLLLAASIALISLQPAPLWTTDRGHWWIAAVLLLLHAACSWWWVRRHQAKVSSNTEVSAQTVLVVHASQTGTAAALAEQTVQTLRSSGVAAELRSMGELQAETLRNASRSLWIVSTTGEGDAPDVALPFLQTLEQPLEITASHEYALLALGDRTYTHYCAFGERVAQWLDASGARAMRPWIAVDNLDPAALEHWQLVLRQLGAQDASLMKATRAPFRYGHLIQRTLLNPGSLGGEAHRISLRTEGEMPNWQAGDILQIAALDEQGTLPAPDAAASQWREYSIASIPQDGAIELLVRLMHDPNGRPGAMSGLLCREWPIGARMGLRIRSNPSFHLPSEDATPLILIGNGTGIAGLRSLLRERVRRGGGPMWLLFGERQRDHDAFFSDELQEYADTGALQQLDVTFSRDGDGEYVWQRLQSRAAQLHDWIGRGAVIMVCGSRASMAADVDRILRDLLGPQAVDDLTRDGRYRRDVY